MGQLEKESRRKARRNEVTKIILDTVKASGIIGLALVAPNVVGALAKLGVISTRRHPEIIRRRVDELYQRGLLRHSPRGLALTKEGKQVLNRLGRNILIEKKRKWDGKWRVVIFDVPEQKRKQRDQLRRTLNSIGFIPLQRSVWVYPYDCEDWITLWKADFRLGRELLYMIVDSIEGHELIKSRFGLN